MRSFFDIRGMIATGVITAVAVLALFVGELNPLLEFNRAAITDGQWWRWFTGHLVHWDLNHGFWDVLMFAVLGATCESRGRGRFLACVVLSAATISVAVWWGIPEMTVYRGLSGIDSALYTLAAALVLRDALNQHAWGLAAICGATLAGFAGKLAFEIVTGTTLFVDSTGGGFVPLPRVHVVGGLVGLLFACGESRRRSTPQTCRSIPAPAHRRTDRPDARPCSCPAVVIVAPSKPRFNSRTARRSARRRR
jgi:rhomboid family GlyGly-CTERM serine protease